MKSSAEAVVRAFYAKCTAGVTRYCNETAIRAFCGNRGSLTARVACVWTMAATLETTGSTASSRSSLPMALWCAIKQRHQKALTGVNGLSASTVTSSSGTRAEEIRRTIRRQGEEERKRGRERKRKGKRGRETEGRRKGGDRKGKRKMEREKGKQERRSDNEQRL